MEKVLSLNLSNQRSRFEHYRSRATAIHEEPVEVLLNDELEHDEKQEEYYSIKDCINISSRLMDDMKKG